MSLFPKKLSIPLRFLWLAMAVYSFILFH